jgi:adenylosuccinate lyase
VGKVSGAVGTYSVVDPSVEEHVCRELGLTPAPASTQVVQRDRHAELMSALAVTAATLEKMAVEVRHLSRTEVREVQEGFAKGQKGSSSMPHKRNPITAERITGLARLVRGNLQAALENVALWHERDISHSSVERVILPDTTIAVHYMLSLAHRLLERLVVFPDRMRENLMVGGGLVFSQAVLTALIGAGMSREEAYGIVQAAAARAWDEGADFRAEIEGSPEVKERLDADALAAAFEPRLEHLDAVFDRLEIWR